MSCCSDIHIPLQFRQKEAVWMSSTIVIIYFKLIEEARERIYTQYSSLSCKAHLNGKKKAGKKKSAHFWNYYCVYPIQMNLQPDKNGNEKGAKK